jgi:hypothetical protein
MSVVAGLLALLCLLVAISAVLTELPPEEPRSILISTILLLLGASAASFLMAYLSAKSAHRRLSR